MLLKQTFQRGCSAGEEVWSQRTLYDNGSFLGEALGAGFEQRGWNRVKNTSGWTHPANCNADCIFCHYVIGWRSGVEVHTDICLLGSHCEHHDGWRDGLFRWVPEVQIEIETMNFKATRPGKSYFFSLIAFFFWFLRNQRCLLRAEVYIKVYTLIKHKVINRVSERWRRGCVALPSQSVCTREQALQRTHINTQIWEHYSECKPLGVNDHDINGVTEAAGAPLRK